MRYFDLLILSHVPAVVVVVIGPVFMRWRNVSEDVGEQKQQINICYTSQKIRHSCFHLFLRINFLTKAKTTSSSVKTIREIEDFLLVCFVFSI